MMMNKVSSVCHTTTKARWTKYQALFVLCILLFCNPAFSQAQTRSLSGTISLDVEQLDKDLSIRVVVRNHSFIVLSVFPFIAIRPVISQQSEVVVIPKGMRSAAYQIDEIEIDPVDYSIQLSCIACGETVPSQYHTPNGNRFSLSGSAYLDPGELHSVLDLDVVTRGQISGEIILDGASISNRQIRLTVSVVDSIDYSIVYKKLDGLVLEEGTSHTPFLVTGLDRSLTDSYRIKVKCVNCYGKSARAVSSQASLRSLQDHQDVNLIITDLPFVIIPQIMEVLL